MSRLENAIEHKLKLEVEKVNGICLKLLPDFIKGIPDRLILLPGGILAFVELKKSPEIEPSKIQKFMHRKLRALGFNVYVIGCKEDCEYYIKELMR